MAIAARAVIVAIAARAPMAAAGGGALAHAAPPGTAASSHGAWKPGRGCASRGGRWGLATCKGGPSKPLAERRMPQPPVRDVAGMLRSFDYAAYSSGPRAEGWADVCRAAYCSGYAEVSGRDPRTDPVLLRAYETDKAIYEVLYEARHRPDWLSVPMTAIERYATTDLF